MAHKDSIITELTADHREVEVIFQQIEALPERRKEYADNATIELVRHSIAENVASTN